ncbi:MFS transporter [Halobacillus shinanisalinarum]|uniref:MFS transporter n=1 Tax=Halobacillus shinanisalinarum TaxID=2932258 RepID=A0ABY4GYD8_9BACI|nr:MFS transporter [Halobacillus shinanisalinarum]UOQ93128.1 MFS transporter [Halobacillus shinanisalinarum]
MFHLLTNRSFRYFVMARLILGLGKKISWVALGWFVYQMTNSASAIGFVIASATIAPLISSILVGGILDQYNRRTIMIAENLLRGAFISVIPILYWFGILSLPIIITVVFINGLLSSFTEIGSATILPSFVDEQNLQSANAIMATAGQLGYLVGPAIGGFSTAFFGAPLTLFIDVFIFFSASFLYFLIPYDIFHQGVNQEHVVLAFKQRIGKFVEDTKVGFEFLFHHKVLIMIAGVTLAFNITYAPLEPVLPVFVSDDLDSGPETLGMIWTIFAVGALIGSFIWARLKIRFYYSYSLGTVITLWGLAPLSFSLFTNEYIVYLIMFLGGIAYAPYNIVEPTLEQQLVPNNLRGRVIGVIGLIAGIGFPLGTFMGGLLGEYIGAANTIFVSGLLTVLLGGIVFCHSALRFTGADVE